MKKNKGHGIACLMIFCIFIIGGFSQMTSAKEGEYGSVNAWIRTIDENNNWGEWQESPAILVHTQLKTHEPFQIKATIENTGTATADVMLERKGYISVFEVVDGPSKIQEEKHYEDANLPKTEIWTLRATGDGIEGRADIRIRAEFKQNNDKDIIDFELIDVYVFSEEWDGSSYEEIGTGTGEDEDKNDGNDSPGFELIFIISAIAIVIYFLRRKNI